MDIQTELKTEKLIDNMISLFREIEEKDRKEVFDKIANNLDFSRILCDITNTKYNILYNP